MIKIAQRTYINIPSDFKIRLTSVETPQGDTVDLSEVSILFSFKDILGNEYKAIYSPVEKDRVNTVYDDDTGILTILFQEYKLVPGQLSCQIGTATPDADFSDEVWDFFGDREQINIILK